MERETESGTRREFLRSVGRTTALAGAAVVTAILAARSLRSGRLQGQTCPNLGICRGCGKIDDCRLPQAMSARNAADKR